MYHNKNIMSRTKLDNGRINQKKRTRKALLDAAAKLVDDGISPTIDEIAEEAQVSRATAYRYFPNPERLLLEAYLDKKIVTADKLFDDVKITNPLERIDIVQDYLHDFVSENEAGFRMYLRACMDEWVSTNGKSEKNLRGGRRLDMIDEALKEARQTLSTDEYKKLRHTLAAMTSIESFVALRDVCRLDSDEAKETMKWSIKILVKAALSE